MTNTVQPVTNLQALLSNGEVSGRLQQLFNQGDINAAKVFLDSILSDRRFAFDPKERPFTIHFNTENSVVNLEYSGDVVSIKEQKRKNIDADLPTRIKKGLAPIDEIEKALLNGSMTDKEFKDAVRHVEPHVSEHYRLLLTHENEVYERKDGPAIKVELNSGVLYAEDEKEREKKAREAKEEALEKDANKRTAEEMKDILAGVLPAVTLEQKLLQGQDMLEVIKYIGLVTDPMQMQMLIGFYANAGIEIVIRDGVLMVANANEYVEEYNRNVDEYKDCQIIAQEAQNELDRKITKAVFGDASPGEINALYAKKEEIEILVENSHKEGKSEEETRAEVDRSIDSFEKELVPTEKTVTTKIPAENLVQPEEQNIDHIDEKKRSAIERCKLLIATGKIDPNVLIRNGRENPAAQKIIKECIEEGIITPENYPALAGYEMANEKSQESLTINKVVDESGVLKYTATTIDITKQFGPKIVYDPNE